MSDTIEPDLPARVQTDYIVRRDFSQQVNGVTVPFKSGAIVRSQSLIAVLLEARAPIEPAPELADLGECPHCKMSFSIRLMRLASKKRAEAAAGAQALLERARALGVA